MTSTHSTPESRANAARIQSAPAETAWATVMGCLHLLQGSLGVDDLGMKDADADDLMGWVDDLEARIGYDVKRLRPAMADYIAARALAASTR